MSEIAKIVLCGQSHENLLEKIANIKTWDNGHNYPIQVFVDEHHWITDSIDNVENAISNDLVGYLEKNFNHKDKMIIKSGHLDDLYCVPKYEYEDNQFHKLRRKSTNFTPKKKKRK